jgi:hypothetical protein
MDDSVQEFVREELPSDDKEEQGKVTGASSDAWPLILRDDLAGEKSTSESADDQGYSMGGKEFASSIFGSTPSQPCSPKLDQTLGAWKRDGGVEDRGPRDSAVLLDEEIPSDDEDTAS